jgi:transposase
MNQNRPSRKSVVSESFARGCGTLESEGFVVVQGGAATPTSRGFGRLKARRRRAARLFTQGGLRQSEIARALGVSRTSVQRWYRAWRQAGTPALLKAGPLGRKPRLTKTDLQLLKRALAKSAREYGFPTETWTLPRVATVIRRVAGVSYHPGHVWRIRQKLTPSALRMQRYGQKGGQGGVRDAASEVAVVLAD